MLSNDQAPLFLSVFILYIALMVFIGWLASRRINKGGTAFLTGGGHLPVFLAVCTAAATLIGTGGTTAGIQHRPGRVWLCHLRLHHHADSRLCLRPHAQQKFPDYRRGNTVLFRG